MVFETWEYDDPEKVAIRREEEMLRKERACGSCSSKISIEWKGVRHNGCQFKRRQYGKRCELFREKK